MSPLAEPGRHISFFQHPSLFHALQPYVCKYVYENKLENSINDEYKLRHETKSNFPFDLCSLTMSNYCKVIIPSCVVWNKQHDAT